MADAYNPHPTKPRNTPPAGAWDTHFHVFDGSDLAGADKRAAYAPVDAPMAALQHMHRTIGIERGVLIQPTSVVPDYPRFIAQLRSDPRLMGVAVTDDDTDDRTLDALHGAGVRGARFHFAAFLKKRPPKTTFERAVARLAELGWHVLVHVEGDDLVELAPMLARLPIPVIVDHIAHTRIADGTNAPGFQCLLSLQQHDHVWIKIANSDRWSRSGAPTYDDAIPFGRAVIANGTERLIWGTDWPHVMYKDPRAPGDDKPDEGHLMDLLFAFADYDETIVRRILVDNPLGLYRHGGQGPAAGLQMTDPA